MNLQRRRDARARQPADAPSDAARPARATASSSGSARPRRCAASTSRSRRARSSRSWARAARASRRCSTASPAILRAGRGPRAASTGRASTTSATAARTELRRTRLRLRLPVRPARAGAAGASRTWRCRSCSTACGARAAGAGGRAWFPRLGPRRARGPAAGRDVRWPGAARGGRAGARHRAVRGVRRRAHRVARLAGRRAGHGAADRRRAGRGAAVVLVTHEPRVAAYADREVVVRDGRDRDGLRRGDPARAPAGRRGRAVQRGRHRPHGAGRRVRDVDPAVRAVVRARARRPATTTPPGATRPGSSTSPPRPTV